jgi:hypothetical protein
MKGSNKQDKKTKVIEILEEKGWDSDYPQVKQVKLYCGNVELKRSNIIASTDKKTIIIEIEEEPTPKNLIGTIGSINILNSYKIKEGDLKPLNDISLFIIIPEMGESTKEQIKTIKKYFKIGEGLLKDFEIVTIEEFENLL